MALRLRGDAEGLFPPLAGSFDALCRTSNGKAPFGGFTDPVPLPDLGPFTSARVASAGTRCGRPAAEPVCWTGVSTSAAESTFEVWPELDQARGISPSGTPTPETNTVRTVK
ncbi:hypothetical protein Skr01_21990 [Sphaerisporangium krabiense]|nr:hypothetical protein Skr01_21990 [Sphaerisporangium krabiense]